MPRSSRSGVRALSSQPYVLCFALDDELRRALADGLLGWQIEAVRDVANARARLCRGAPPALSMVTFDRGVDAAVAIARLCLRHWPRGRLALIGRGRSSQLEAIATEMHAELVLRNGGVDRTARTLTALALEGMRVREAQRTLASLFAARWKLSDRQHDCVRLLAYGVPQFDLADRLGVSPRAVDDHLRKVRDRCGEVESCGLIQRLLELAVEAALRREHGWLGRLGEGA